MQLQELVKNALIDAGLMDYAEDTARPDMFKQGMVMAEQSINALNNDPALAFGLITFDFEDVKDKDILFPLLEFIGTENSGILLEEQRHGYKGD